MLRAFIAIEIPPALHERIAAESAALQKDLAQAVRWVRPQNIHLTLKFLGDTSPASLENLAHALGGVAARQMPFQIEVGGFGLFPNSKRPRILWIGIQSPPDLEQLQRAIESTCARLGYPLEGKPFSPHLTIGRLREEAALGPALQEIRIGQIGSLRVENLTLFRSDLHPQGPIYTALAQIPLAQTHSQNQRGEP